MAVTKTPHSKNPFKSRYIILGQEEIPTGKLHPHPRNPRPSFQLSADDEKIRALADSIKTEGQHTAALAYEIPGETGEYRIVQGERRWRACQLARVPTVLCNLAAAPVNPAQELEWLGVEESHKQSWQTFFQLKHAHELAVEYNVSVAHSEIASKTGLSMADLRIAEKLFQLDEQIQDMCVQYERALYEQSLVSGRKRSVRLLYETRSRVPEFPVQKGALVYDIFRAIRDNFPAAARDYSDKELQILVANRATSIGTTLRDLEQFLSAIRVATIDGSNGFVVELANLLQHPTKTLRDVNKSSGTHISNDMMQFIKRTETLGSSIQKMLKSRKGLGADIDALQKASRNALILIRDLGDFEREVSAQIRKMDS